MDVKLVSVAAIVGIVVVLLYSPELIWSVDGSADMDACNAAKSAADGDIGIPTGTFGMRCLCTDSYGNGYFVILNHVAGVGNFFVELDANHNKVEVWDRHAIWKDDTYQTVNDQLSSCHVKSQEEVNG